MNRMTVTPEIIRLATIDVYTFEENKAAAPIPMKERARETGPRQEIMRTPCTSCNLHVHRPIASNSPTNPDAAIHTMLFPVAADANTAINDKDRAIFEYMAFFVSPFDIAARVGPIRMIRRDCIAASHATNAAAFREYFSPKNNLTIHSPDPIKKIAKTPPASAIASHINL